jgi:hypothetical protein
VQVHRRSGFFHVSSESVHSESAGTKARSFHVDTRIRPMKLLYALPIAALAVAVAQDDLAWHERAKKAAEDASKAVKEANDKASQAFVESGAKAKLNETARHAQREAQRNWVFLTEVSDKVAANAEDAVERRMFDLQQQAFNFFKLSDEMIKTLEEMAWNLLQIAILLLATRYFSADLMLLIVGIVLLSGSGLIKCFLKFVWFLLWLAALAPHIFLLFLFVALFVRSRTRGVLMRACGIEDDALSKVSGAMSDACLDAWKLATSKTPFIRLEDSGDNWKDAALDPAMAARLDKIDNKIEAMIDALAKRERVAVNMGVQGAATGTGGGNGVTHILQGA